MEIGELLKKYRIRHQLTQKEMTKEVVSVSFYSKVESGIHKISAEDLLTILQKNGISFDSFFSNLSNETNLVIDTKESITKALVEAYFQGNELKIKNLKNNVNESSQILDSDKILLNAIIESMEASLLEDISALSDKNKDILKNYLFNLPEWDSFKLSLFCNLMDIYDLNTNIMMVSSILKKDLTTYLKTGQTIVVTILINMISNCIENDSDHLALLYIDLVDSVPTTPTIFFEKILAEFYSEFIIYKKDKNKDSEAKLVQIINIISMSGMNSYSKALKEIINK